VSRLPPLRTLAAVLTILGLSAAAPGYSQAPSSFAAQVAALSEPGGYFDTDNLISNERSYLQVLPALQRTVQGGAYIGVGPDQNFSYIAAVRPEIAFIVDIRRDNLLLHLLFKALFDLSPTRVEYLAGLLGRPAPPDPPRWRHASIQRIVEYVDRDAAGPDARAALRRRLHAAIRETGVLLDEEDLRTIDRFHGQFVDQGIALRFNSRGRAPQSYYPTYRELLLETDADGRQAGFLASEEAFSVVKQLQARDRIVPVVGDLSGPSALHAIGRLLATERRQVSAIYTSNVEFYLYRQNTHPQFIANLQRLPRSERSVIVRAVFGRFATHGRPGDASTSELQPLGELLRGFQAGLFRSYGQLAGGR
jgi:hypothetical protein